MIGADTELKLKRKANCLRINWPTTSEDVEKAKKRLRIEHINLWAELRSQDEVSLILRKRKLGTHELKSTICLSYPDILMP